MEGYTQAQAKPKPDERPVLNLLFNIVLPVLILNRGGKFGPLLALGVALCFPVGFGLYEYIKRRRRNYISLLGIINTLVTGGFAVLHLHGMWFAVKDAFFPFLIGAFVAASARTQRPFIKTLFYNPTVIDVNRVESALRDHGHEADFENHLRVSTWFLSTSFFLSAVLNFFLARSIFTDIDSALPADVQAAQLNAQIAHMTWLAYLVIVLPCMLVMGGIFWYFTNGIQKMTKLKTSEYFHKD